MYYTRTQISFTADAVNNFEKSKFKSNESSRCAGATRSCFTSESAFHTHRAREIRKMMRSEPAQSNGLRGKVALAVRHFRIVLVRLLLVRAVRWLRHICPSSGELSKTHCYLRENKQRRTRRFLEKGYALTRNNRAAA